MDSQELVGEVNARNLKVGEMFYAADLDSPLDPFWLNSPLEFFCECGCWQTVTLTVSEYREGGAWVPGHQAAPGQKRFFVKRT